jgi:hypothetical protein
MRGREEIVREAMGVKLERRGLPLSRWRRGNEHFTIKVCTHHEGNDNRGTGTMMDMVGRYTNFGS